MRHDAGAPPLPFPSPEWLERANRLALLGRILSGVVHDVNNSLQVVGGSSELLLMASAKPDVVRRRAEAMGTQSKRASDLLARLTAFARDTSDQVAPVSLKEVAGHALALRSYALSTLRLDPVIEGDDVTVVANARRVLQILLNLIVNAERTLGQISDGRLRLVIGRRDGFGTVGVEDNGGGIPAAALPGLFDPRVDQTCVVANLGIGLGVSRWLAEQDRGQLACEAPPSGGARFTLALPLSRG